MPRHYVSSEASAERYGSSKSDTVRICNGNVGRKQESSVRASVQQTFTTYIDRRSTVYEGQEGGFIGLAIGGEERMGRR